MSKYEYVHEVERLVHEDEPSIGGTDVSKCLPGWIKSFCAWNEDSEPHELSHSAIRNMCHTLIAARARAHRLVCERDALMAENERLKKLHAEKDDAWKTALNDALRMQQRALIAEEEIKKLKPVHGSKCLPDRHTGKVLHWHTQLSEGWNLCDPDSVTINCWWMPLPKQPGV